MDDQTPVFEPALFTITHKLSKHALTRRGYDVTVEPLHSSINQQWKLSGGGYIQSGDNDHVYMSPTPDCTGAFGTTDPAAPWIITRLGDATIEIRTPCGTYLSVDPLEKTLVTVSTSSDLTHWNMVYTRPTSSYAVEKSVKIF